MAKKRVSRPPRGSGRQKLIDTATMLFSKQGYDRTSLDEIAEHAGLSKGLVHKYYGGKEGLREAVDKHISDRRRALFSRVLESVDSDHMPPPFGSFRDPKDIKELESTGEYMRARLWEPPNQTTELHLKMTFRFYLDEINSLQEKGLLRPEVADDKEVVAMVLAYLGFGYLLLNPLGVKILSGKKRQKQEALDRISQELINYCLISVPED